MGISGGLSNFFNTYFVNALKAERLACVRNMFKKLPLASAVNVLRTVPPVTMVKAMARAWRRDLQYLNGRGPDHLAEFWAGNSSLSPRFRRVIKQTLQTRGRNVRSALKFIARDRIKQAAVGVGVVGGIMVSVISVHASLQDPATIKVIQDPKFYLGIESGYGRMALNGNGLSLATPGLPKTGIFGDQALSGSFLFGAGNFINLGNGMSLRGELEYQKLGRPNELDVGCCTTTPLSMFYSRSVETNSGFANLWLDFDLPFESTKLFLGGGVGFASHSVASVNSAFNSGQNLQLAYHLGGGISHSLSPDVDFVVAGRYRDLGSSRLNMVSNPGGSRSLKHTGFEARIGLRYKLESLMPKH